MATATPIKHTEWDPKWEGNPDVHDDHVWNEVMSSGRIVKPWDWFEVICDEPMCLLVEHIRVNTPTRLEYPPQVCTYCGIRSGTRDHLVTKVWSGLADRKWVLTVPACAECNGLIGADACTSIDGRRAIAKKKLRKRRKRQLNYQILTEDDLEEYGPGLRPLMREASNERLMIEYRLAWPTDPFYDLRYLEKSGIPDPVSTGLLEKGPLERIANEEGGLAA